MMLGLGCSSESSTASPAGDPAASSSSSGSPSGSSSSSGGSSSGGGDGGSSGGGAGADAGPITSSGCGGSSAAAGNLDWTIKSDGRDRTVRVHVPPGYDSTKPTPVVLNFHGRNSTAQQEELISGMTPKADAKGYVVVYPTGVGQTWNAGLCCGQAQTDNIDDVGFTRALIDELEKKLCVDKRRVFATGLSNGGFMSNRLGCELADRIAAIGPVAGQLLSTPCTPSRPMPVMHFHGTADAIVSYQGSIGVPGVEGSLKDWAKRNGCNLTPTQTYTKGDTKCVTYGQCTAGADVTLCTVDGGGHTWPGGFAVPGLGKTTKDINATDAMWDFFVAHPMP